LFDVSQRIGATSLHSSARSDLDVLIVGAGPAGLALAAQLRWFGTSFRIVDRSLDRARESRALAVQARTLELFDMLDLAAPLVERGNTSARLALHLGARQVAEVQLGAMGAVDTRFPFILFVSQADGGRTRPAPLGRRREDRARRRAREVCGGERRRALHPSSQQRSGDGASALRRRVRWRAQRRAQGAGFAFEGGSYPQDFVLGDVEADGLLEPDAINPFVGGGGVAMFFPLGRPRRGA
jgi:hypothetical protein